jgi:hypothetical protein
VILLVSELVRCSGKFLTICFNTIQCSRMGKNVNYKADPRINFVMVK